MAEYLNAKCSICGRKYHVCNDCAAAKSFTPWRKVACSVDCYRIFTVLNDYTNGRTDKEETKKLLSRYDLSGKDTFEANIKASIEEITGGK